MSDRIDYAAEARQWLVDAPAQAFGEGCKATPAEKALICAGLAQADALLALVEQVRVANLIALSVPQEVPNGAMVSISVWDFDPAKKVSTR